ncbi:hypothetical protein QBC44DRAFT_334156 [Cladorrhinum sp. PSN332]|nr:hypothetical protein QBC44DRAFT_334156 [Cladorrhinum sp. PSN332]
MHTMIPRILRRLTPKSLSPTPIPKHYKPPLCRTIITKTPGNPYPIIDSRRKTTYLLPQDIPDFHYMSPKNPSYESSIAPPVKPGSKVQNFGRVHNIAYWTDTKTPKGQGKINSYGLRLRSSRNHTFSNYDEEALGWLSHPLTEKVLWRYLQKKKVPLWIYATAYSGPDNSIAVVRRKCEKRMKAALYFALAELGFDKHGRALREGSKEVCQGSIVLTSSFPKKLMATDFDQIVKDLAEFLSKAVMKDLVRRGVPETRSRPPSRSRVSDSAGSIRRAYAN